MALLNYGAYYSSYSSYPISPYVIYGPETSPEGILTLLETYSPISYNSPSQANPLSDDENQIEQYETKFSSHPPSVEHEGRPRSRWWWRSSHPSPKHNNNSESKPKSPWLWRRRRSPPPLSTPQPHHSLIPKPQSPAHHHGSTASPPHHSKWPKPISPLWKRIRSPPPSLLV
ncbi:polyadenylate-binding protein 1 [Striga asiatica]|uniref:Polyadenylate-binding protein 1 n=1 Tax=Striga asiatica TaxID=4170 RepID=A0A5A7QFW4_STRAF|nr:polyadenylate-binding protein 1 [Striga asiatica]